MTLEDLISKYHFIQLGEDGVVELYFDHHSLSAFRMCEAYFELSIQNSIKPKERIWSLELGIVYHKMLEIFYTLKQKDEFIIEKWLSYAIELWDINKMEEFKEHKTFKALGGLHGFVALLAQYAQHFASEVDRLRIIGMEIPFGKAKEVYLGEFKIYQNNGEAYDSLSYKKIRCYYSGRIDLLMDNGVAIGPLDHKTFTFFRGVPTEMYDPQEGMTGYIFATRAIVQKNFPEMLRSRKLDRIWLNCAQITPTKENLEDPHKRFKRIPILKTDYQLEQWRLRQLSTFSKIYDILTGSRIADWNAAMCSNMYWRECPYKNLHRQNSSSNLLTILNNDFKQAEAWNPELVSEEQVGV